MKLSNLYCLSVIFFAAFNLQAQSLASHKKQYPFVNWGAHKLQFYGDTTHYNKFFGKLEQLVFEGYGQVQVMQIGGSHVQAGTMTRQLREHFHALSPGLMGERGFMFPYHLAKTNNPYDYKTIFTGQWEGHRAALGRGGVQYGLAATAAETYDSTATVVFYAEAEDGTRHQFNQVRIFYEFSPESFDVELLEGYNITHTRRDSVSNYKEFFFDVFYDTLKFRVVKSDSLQKRLNIHGIQYLNGTPGVTFHSIGANGASVPTYLKSEKFQAHLAACPPDLVIFGIGINDANKPQSEFRAADYKAHYQQLMQQIKAVNPDVCFFFITNNDSYYQRKYPNPNALQVRMVMQELAAEHNGAVWDLFEVMGGLGGSLEWEKQGLVKADKIHFTPEGYRLQGDLMFDGIKTAFGNYLSRKHIIKLAP